MSESWFLPDLSGLAEGSHSCTNPCTGPLLDYNTLAIIYIDKIFSSLVLFADVAFEYSSEFTVIAEMLKYFRNYSGIKGINFFEKIYD